MGKVEKKYKLVSAGFEKTNPKAEVIIVGITPGNSQLKTGVPNGMDSLEIKRNYAFAGSIRSNLIELLDYVGVNRILGILTCKTIWEEDFERIDMTSLLKRATFDITTGEEKMFKDVERIFKEPKLKEEFDKGFVEDCKKYENAKIFVACGSQVYDVLLELKRKGVITAQVIGIAHPSAQNKDRIAYYQGKETKPLLWCKEKSAEAIETVNRILSEI